MSDYELRDTDGTLIHGKPFTLKHWVIVALVLLAIAVSFDVWGTKAIVAVLAFTAGLVICECTGRGRR